MSEETKPKILTVNLVKDHKPRINRISQLCKRVPIHSRMRIKAMLESGSIMLLADIDNTPVGHIIAKKDERDLQLFMIDLQYDTQEIKESLIRAAKEKLGVIA